MGKSEEKKGFFFKATWAIMIESMPSEKAGDLIKAVCSFYRGNKSYIEDPIILAMFKFITSQITEDEEK